MKKTIKVITEYLKNHEPDNIIRSEYTRHEWTKKWNLKDEYQVSYYRGIRGDLIELLKKDIPLVSWVDQSHQYDNLLGINDFKATISLDKVKEILG